MVMMGEGQLARGDMTYMDTNADSCHGDLKIKEEKLLWNLYISIPYIIVVGNYQLASILVKWVSVSIW